MSKEIKAELFDYFLNWLDPERDTAAKKYQALRAQIISFLVRRRCTEPEKLADDALTIFAHRLPHLREKIRDPLPYLTVVARNLNTELITSRHLPLPADIPAAPPSLDETEEERIFESLEECLRELRAEDRELFLQYFEWESQDRADFRKEMSAQRGITPNALRLRIHKIKLRLRRCINDRLGRTRAEMD